MNIRAKVIFILNILEFNKNSKLHTDDDANDSQTEGEELARAREIRKQEVQLKPLPILPTDTETDVSNRLLCITTNFNSILIF